MEVGQIFVVSGEDQIETHKVFEVELPRRQPADIDAVRPSNRLRAPVWCSADMPIAGSGRIDLHPNVGIGEGRPRRAFGQRRTTDIAKAQKQD